VDYFVSAAINMKINFLKSASVIILLAALLPTLSAQDGKSEKSVIEFNEKIHDFGDILLSDGPVKCTFSFKNVSDSPIVVYNVVSSCGCTTPNWTREPVKPGQSGEIRVVFNNDQGPYPFEKTLTVYVSGVNRPVVLRIRGTAHEKKKNISELYPVHLGKLGLRKKELTLGYVDQGRDKSQSIEVSNLSKNDIKVTSGSSSAGLSVEINPNPIPAYGTATMVVTLDTKKMDAICWGRQNLNLKFRINGKETSDAMKVSANIKDDFSAMSKEQIQRAGSPVIKKSYFEFGEVRSGKTVEAEYTISNEGGSDFIVHKVESETKELMILTPYPFTVKRGSRVQFKVRLNTSSLEGEVLVVMTAITDTPDKPMFNLFLTGNIIN